MKSGFSSRGVHIFDGCERLRVPTKSGCFFLGFFFLFPVCFRQAVLEREENEECLA